MKKIHIICVVTAVCATTSGAIAQTQEPRSGSASAVEAPVGLVGYGMVPNDENTFGNSIAAIFTGAATGSLTGTTTTTTTITSTTTSTTTSSTTTSR